MVPLYKKLAALYKDQYKTNLTVDEIALKIEMARQVNAANKTYWAIFFREEEHGWIVG